MSPEISLQAAVPAGPDRFTFRTADGVTSPREFRAAELELIETLWEQSLGSLLVLQANYGVVGTVLSHAAQSVVMTETSARNARLCRTNASSNDSQTRTVLSASPIDRISPVDTCCYAPREYTPVSVATRRLVAGLSVLSADGRCYVAGRPTGGLNRYEACLRQHCDSVSTVATSGEIRVLEATGPAVENPRSVERSQYTAAVDGVELSVVTAPGLFSPDGLDDGTRQLLDTVSLADGLRVLDLCCGCGPVGAYAAQTADVDVWLSDDDARSTECARRTLDCTGVDGTVITADGTRQVDGPFDHVVCNPPTHAGSGVLSELFAGVRDVLAPGGTLSVVHHQTLDLSPSLSQFGAVVEQSRGESHTVVQIRR